ncbi:hypothetical protein KHQ81_15015 [Mycoplasmatota bacterium]|nr:hypothetical protein KHQ81_15015 [Mycoplasmatota bacterium]
MDRLIIIVVAVLSFCLGMLWNYTRWRISGKIYERAKVIYTENIELRFENAFLKHELEEKNEI